jgi:hypothetical protein
MTNNFAISRVLYSSWHYYLNQSFREQLNLSFHSHSTKILSFNYITNYSSGGYLVESTQSQRGNRQCCFLSHPVMQFPTYQSHLKSKGESQAQGNAKSIIRYPGNAKHYSSLSGSPPLLSFKNLSTIR